MLIFGDKTMKTYVGLNKMLGCLIIAFLLLFSSCDSKKDQQNLHKIVVQFGWLPDTHHAGFWIALDKGYYKEEGLDVELLLGGLDSSPLKAVVSGAVDIGQAGGLEQLITAIDEGLPIRAIASFHRDTPQALISLEQNPILTPSDFAGKTIAVAFGDAAEILLKTYMKKTGIENDKVKCVPFRFDLTPLINGRVDAITGFSTDQPATLYNKGLSPVVLRYSDVGIRSYGYTFFCSQSTLAKKSKYVNAFLRASRRGWSYAFDHPEEAVAIMIKYFSNLRPEIEKKKFDLVRELMCDKDGNLAEWKLENEVVNQVIQMLLQNSIIKSSLSANEIIANKAPQGISR